MRAVERTLSLVRQHPSRLRVSAWYLKRLLETIAAALMLVVLSPILLFLALAVWSTGPGPVLLRQRRIGRDGRPFEILKFRTLHVNGDSDTTWSVERDTRITAVGSFLRDTSLDELPQLVNVIHGEMALVGPRPERPYFVRQFEAEVSHYAARHRVRPGITGWAQVHGLHGDSSIPDRVRFDNEYIDNWSLRRDAVIIVRTVVEMAGLIMAGSLARIRRLSRKRGAPLSVPTHKGGLVTASAHNGDSAGSQNRDSAAASRSAQNGEAAATLDQEGDRARAKDASPLAEEPPTRPSSAW